MRPQLLILALLAAPAMAAECLVVHPGSVLHSLSVGEVKDIYLGRRTAWDDGSQITVVLASSGSSNTAMMSLLEKNPSQFSISWKKIVFAGRGAMPELVKDDQAVIDFVAAHPAAIGFVDDAVLGTQAKAKAITISK